MSEAIFGLVGVVIGGLLNGGALWLVERRRDRRDARTAARMLIPELREARRRVLFMLENDGYVSSLSVGTERWEEWESDLAARLDGATWGVFHEVYHGFGLLNGLLAGFAEQLEQSVDADTDEELDPGADTYDAEWLSWLHDSSGDAVEALARIAGLNREAREELVRDPTF